MFVDNFVLNGQGHGEVGEQLGACRYDAGLLRPYRDEHGRVCVTVNTGQHYDTKKSQYVPSYEKRTIKELALNSEVNIPITNAATTLRKDEWLQLDRQIVRISRERLKAWADLTAANTFGGFNAMAKMILEHETMSDPGEAFVDMDARSDVRGDTPTFQLEGLPLPITHSGFTFSQRRLMVSRNTGTPLDMTMGEAAGRRVSEAIEKTLIGTQAGLTYGVTADYGNTPTVYGYTNHPNRATKTDMTPPDGTNGPTVLTEWLAVRDLLYAQNHFGPYVAYTSTDYDQFLDNLFSTTEPSAGTLRSRLLQIDGVNSIRRLDFLTNTFTLLLIQMTSDVARAINGMPITTIQWESRGGLEVNFKVMAIQVPQLRADNAGNSGIAHATTT